MNQLICNEFAPQRVPEITRRHPLGLPPSIVACEVYQKRPQLHGCTKSFPWRHCIPAGLPSVEIALNASIRGFSTIWIVVILPRFDSEPLAQESTNHSI